jgi:DNA (cytosine-5)-methyltransferase 1
LIKLNGLDLFSGIGGITKALEEWIQPIAYCENDRYAQAVLLSRMQDGTLPIAPIWDDITTLDSSVFITLPDIVYGGFPCQDISCANTSGMGLEGKRSGLFFDVERLVREIRPRFVFLENVPAIRTRGGSVVGSRLADAGYDCRWITLSASEVGANHQRKRWFLLAHSRCELWTGAVEQGTVREETERGNADKHKRSGEVAHAKGRENIKRECRGMDEKTGTRQGVHSAIDTCREDVADAEGRGKQGIVTKRSETWGSCGDGWWATEPDVGRVAHGVSFRVDRLRALGNSVVPAQAKEAFKILMGI